MNGRHSGSSTGEVVSRAMMVIALVTAAMLVYPAPQIRSVAGAALYPSPASTDAVAEVQGLLGKRQAARMDYLAAWPPARLERLHVWLSHGIAFEGPWASEELDLVLTVLDGFGATYGEARFVELSEAAVAAASFGLRHHLRLVKVMGRQIPAAVWFGRSGKIRFNEGLFDDAYFGQYYYWSFLLGEYADPGPEVKMRHAVIGHELGHVLIDGLRLEMPAAGHDRMALEALYTEMIEPAQWPHQGVVANEALATELAVWALGVGRTAQVDALRAALSAYFPTTGPAFTAMAVERVAP
jgi:hypothetical protein